MFRAVQNLRSATSNISGLDSPSVGLTASGSNSTLRNARPTSSSSREESGAVCALPAAGPLVISAPTPLKPGQPLGSPRVLALNASGIWTTTVGPSSKRTLASWHVESPQEIINSLAELANTE